MNEISKPLHRFKGVPNIGLAAEHGFCYRIPSILGDEWYQEATTTDLSWKNVLATAGVLFAIHYAAVLFLRSNT